MENNAHHILRLLTEHLPDLKKKYPISQLALFGSVVRDDFNPATSDIDIMVEFNGAIGWEFIDLADELQKLLHFKVDLISRNGIKPRHWEYIRNDLKYV